LPPPAWLGVGTGAAAEIDASVQSTKKKRRRRRKIDDFLLVRAVASIELSFEKCRRELDQIFRSDLVSS
jgi:hypothetical protein